MMYLAKGCPHEFALPFRKVRPVGLDGLPCAIECGHQDTDGARIKDVIAEKVAHFAPLQGEVILPGERSRSQLGQRSAIWQLPRLALFFREPC